MPTQTFFNLPPDKRSRLIELAIDEFAARDYREASISRIVAQANIAKGSFYQYFTDKKELYFYLLQLAAEEKRSFLQSAMPVSASEGFFFTLRQLFQAGLGFQFSNPKLAQIAYRALFGDAPFADESLAQMRVSSRQFIAQLVAEGMAEGDIDSSLDAELVGFVLDLVLNGFGEYLLVRTNVSSLELARSGGRAMDQPAYWPAVADLLRILQYGLAPRPTLTLQE